jgi:2-polyprenyl-6-methoxyphenol hydroxylase-like FAD-dependent oxidoreductase
MKRHVLISGARVTGSTTAYWLAHHGFDVTVIEKASAFRDGGQNVDVRGAGREVLRRMGLEEAAKAKTTGERGTDWVDEKDGVVARFAVDVIGDGPTAEMEILRGDIARLIFEAARPQAVFRFGDAITSLDDDGVGVTVDFVQGQTRAGPDP